MNANVIRVAAERLTIPVDPIGDMDQHFVIRRARAMVHKWSKGDRVLVIAYHADPDAIGCTGVVAYSPSSDANPVLRVVVDRSDAERVHPGIVEWELNATANEHFKRIEPQDERIG